MITGDFPFFFFFFFFFLLDFFPSELDSEELDDEEDEEEEDDEESEGSSPSPPAADVRASSASIRPANIPSGRSAAVPTVLDDCEGACEAAGVWLPLEAEGAGAPTEPGARPPENRGAGAVRPPGNPTGLP